MKIEKLTENKIRIIVDSYEFKKNNLDINKLSAFTIEKQSFFSNLIKEAKKVINFELSGYKLLIEFFSTDDGFFVFTLTKYPVQEKKKSIVKQKQSSISNNTAMFKFETFDNFIDFCNCIKNNQSYYKQNNISKKSYLYCYNNTYFLLLKDINNSYENNKYFNSLVSEFANHVSYSNAFENKLLEYGNVIIKNKAIEKVLKYFV